MAGEMRLSGVVASGTGEGKYFMAIEGYAERFGKLLGAKPYPGTLNIMLDSGCVKDFKALRSMKGIRIEGFVQDGKQFGGVSLFWARLKGMRCAVVIPDKSRYETIVEVVSEKNMRKELSLKNGDRASVAVRL